MRNGLSRLSARFAPPLLFAVLTLVFWGAFVPERGLVGETIWIELSESRPGLSGFLYPYDASRRLMSVPFHLAYLTSNGSYLPLFIVYGALLWATGVLTWLIVRELLPAAPFLALLAGALAIVHGADRSIGFVAMVVVRQSVTGVLFAAWALLHGWNRRRRWLLPIAAAGQAVALWTYEPAFTLIAAIPVIWWKRPVTGALVRWTIGWFAVPAIFVLTLVARYLFATGASYQAAELQWPSLTHAVQTMAGFLYNGLAFWQWPAPWWQDAAAMCRSLVLGRVTPPLALAAGVFGVSAFVYSRRPDSLPPLRPVALMRLLAVIAAAYVPFVLLTTVDAPGISGYWRVHFYAAPALAVALAAAVGYAAAVWRLPRPLVMIVATLLVSAGLAAGLMSQLDSVRRWVAYRRVAAGILAQAPRVRDDTFIALTEVPRKAAVSLCPGYVDDPYADTMWFNSALQLMYPRTRVAGSYWRRDGEMSGSVQYRFTANGVDLHRTSVTVEGTHFGYDRVIAFEYDQNDGARLLGTLPTELAPFPAARSRYQPSGRIVAGAPPPETIARFELR